MSGKVLIRTSSAMRSFALVSPEPMTADANGHVWLFDGGASDMDAPYSCGLCGEAQWKSYRTPCEERDRLAAANADRSAYINAHRIEEGKR